MWPWLDRLALVATLACPILLLHGRGAAEALIGLVAASFLLASAGLGDWSWLRRRWVRIALAWWLWLVVCSSPLVGGLGEGGSASLLQALVQVRLLLFTAALEHRVLRAAWARRVLAWLIALAATYIALQCVLQIVFGRNLFGVPRYSDGALTGPYDHPRAGPPFSRLLFPTLLPAVAWLRARGRRLAAAALALAAVALMVEIGQRMPLLLTGLGLLVTALMLPRLRLLVLSLFAAAALLVPATRLAAPGAYHHLVIRFSEQMAHFETSDYGLLATRALRIAAANPWTGRGYDGFRTGCPDPRYFGRLDLSNLGAPPPAASATDPPVSLDRQGGGAYICLQHPHNHYLQAVTDAGLPGLALFCLMVLAWLAALGRGLWRRSRRDRLTPHGALRVGLFVAALLQEWPIASTSSFSSMPLSGWFFLLLGLGLATAQADDVSR